MDPVSAVASIITLLAAAGSSCRFLHDFIHTLAEAPAEMQSQNTRLESLHRAFSNLLQIYSSLPQDTPVDTVLTSRINEFIREISTVKERVVANNVLITPGRRHNIRARFKWLASDHQLQKFLASLQQWNVVFSQEMLAVQT
jgi:hypothetical protein